MTDAQQELAQVREALAAGPTPGPWFAVNDGNRTEPFMNVKAERISGRGPTHEVAICATGDSPQSMETANARYIAACSPVNIAAILAHVETQAAEIERLTAALRAQPGPVSMDDMEWAGKVHLAEAIRERDELRRQLAEAEQDAERYRWLRNEANTARKCDPMVCIYPLDEQDLIDGDRLDIAIDAAMGASNE